MDRMIEKQLRRLYKKEKSFLREKNPSIFGKAREGLESRIPKGLKEKLEAGFYHGFKLVFSKGTGIIEKTYDKKKMKSDYEIMDFIFHKNQKKRALKGIKKKSFVRQSANMGLTALEGSLLGVFGIGLPDIPVFMGVLLKGIYETALSYGFSYDTREEQYYILLMIEAALSADEKQERNDMVDEMASLMDQNISTDFSLEEQMKRTASALAMDMLCVKFIQGFPVVGIVGGVTNVVCFIKITDYARMKYQKRYLLSKAAAKAKE